MSRDKELRKIIEGWFTHQEPEENFLVEGHIYQITIGPRARQRTVHAKKLYDRIGAQKFFEKATFPLQDLDRLGIDTAGIVVEERTGNRTVTAILRMAANGPPKPRKAKKSAASGSKKVVSDEPKSE